MSSRNAYSVLQLASTLTRIMTIFKPFKSKHILTRCGQHQFLDFLSTLYLARIPLRIMLKRTDLGTDVAIVSLTRDDDESLPTAQVRMYVCLQSRRKPDFHPKLIQIDDQIAPPQKPLRFHDLYYRIVALRVTAVCVVGEMGGSRFWFSANDINISFSLCPSHVFIPWPL